MLLKGANERLKTDSSSTALARTFAMQGLGKIDALHLALAEWGGCDILLTTDDAFLRRAGDLKPRPNVRVLNPVLFLAELVAEW